ncbi:GyrI-like domain-containing protein [Chelativorans salis]|uniref:GyrI-like domain-containing protein n=1 Tax=Chelativorans salis TaxID=2978478 RepID=A0ABT2LNI6_9HYPH|nr:GyrI-like domain-containing protein [Chelativorans sp. EGI FJ00035]MCT7375629.1 GyrI-like domain-containing protein [Chelativorans sp. EGI FJ00035]
MAFEVKTREAQTLFGKVWEGSFEGAAAGHVKTVVADMERRRNRLAAGRSDAAGLVGISWNNIPGGFRYLVALPPELSGQGEAEGLQAFSFPEMRFATAWHEATDGDVFAHYERMFAWIEENEFRRVTDILHHREEYPAGLDLDSPPRLRLMTPLASLSAASSGT